MREIKASEFKAKCLNLIDQVAAGGEAIIITKRGRPLARLSREPGTAGEPLLGSMRGVIEIADPDDPLLSVYDAEDLAAQQVDRERRAELLHKRPKSGRKIT